jgi:dihydrofolate reductase
MGRIIVSENVSIDGVVQDPTGDEGFKHGGWFNQMSGKDREAWATAEFEEARAAAALLLGRRSDEFFAARWSSRTGAWADRLNSMPKFVVSATLDKPRWSNATILSGEVVTELSKLKQELDGDIVVLGSAQLVHTPLDHGLVDELRLMIHPFVLGSGQRLFAETSDATPLRLVHTRAVGDSLALLTYQVARAV